MVGDRNVRQSSSWRARAGAFGVAVATGLALTPLAMTVTTPATVQAGMMQLDDNCDSVTSGGFVVTDAGKKANFGVHGGCKNGDLWGHLNYVDHVNGYHVQSVEITGYVVNAGGNPNARDVCGVAQTNDPADPETLPFIVRLVDNGEPGSGDEFALKLGPNPVTSQQYAVTQRPLGTARPGGNVQVHRPNASTAPWAATYGTCAVSFGGVE